MACKLTVLTGLPLTSGRGAVVRNALELCPAGLAIAAIVPSLDELAILSDSIHTKSEDKIVLTNDTVVMSETLDVRTCIAQLVATQEFDYILAVVDDIVDFMEAAGEEIKKKKTLADVVEIDTVVTVVDACTFMDDFFSEEVLGDRTSKENTKELADVNLVDMLTEQVEVASVLVMNNWDLVDKLRQETLSAVFSHMAPHAKQVTWDHGISFANLFGTNSITVSTFGETAGWLTILRGDPIPRNTVGITSFVFRARRPFHPRRLHEVMELARGGGNCLSAAFRSKGLVWIASRNDKFGEWSQAGSLYNLDCGENWYCVTSKSKWPKDKTKVAEIKNSFSEDQEVGDRRQEVVFIGKNLDHFGIEDLLGNTLLTDEEYAFGPTSWIEYEDPLPRWDHSSSSQKLLSFDEKSMKRALSLYRNL